jgi:uncharacterized membrane protein (DUF373 family)
MSDSIPSQTPRTNHPPQTSPLKCVTGSLLAGSLALLLYRLTTAIAQSFAAHPLQSHSQIAISISVAVRTLVVGVSTLGTGIFGLTALGLIALAVQILVQRLSKRGAQSSNSQL